jgi:predicted porin
MKKTLIALAAVAVSSAAMAQATISGTVSAGYKSTNDAGTKANGFGFDDNEFRISTAEDLGDGVKVTATLTLDSVADKKQVTGDGVTLAITGGFGGVSFSQVGSSDYLPIDGLTKQADGTTGDRVTYTLPSLVKGLTASVTYKDGDETQGLGVKAITNTATTYSVEYNDGPLTAGLLYAKFTDRNAANSLQNRVGAKIGYNFGVAAVSYGMLNTDSGTADDVKETALTVSAPLGPVSASFSMATSKTGTAKKLDGTALSLSYALSKRTSVVYYNESHDKLGTTDKKVKEQSLLLAHKF